MEPENKLEKLDLLIVEDNEKTLAEMEDNADLLVSFRITWAKDQNEALEACTQKNFQVCSIDQRLPKKTGEQEDDKLGLNLRERIQAQNPLCYGMIYTNFEKTSHVDKHPRWDYLSKNDCDLEQWINKLEEYGKKYRENLFLNASEVLPAPLARKAALIHAENQPLRRLSLLNNFWEAGLKLATMQALALQAFWDEKAPPPWRWEQQRLEPAVMQKMLRQFAEHWNQQNPLPPQLVEWQRFAGRNLGKLLAASEELRRFRNEWAHHQTLHDRQALERWESADLTTARQKFVESLAFWAWHPLTCDFKPYNTEEGTLQRGHLLQGNQMAMNAIGKHTKGHVNNREVYQWWPSPDGKNEIPIKLSPFLQWRWDSAHESYYLYALHDLRDQSYQELSQPEHVERRLVSPQEEQILNRYS